MEPIISFNPALDEELFQFILNNNTIEDLELMADKFNKRNEPNNAIRLCQKAIKQLLHLVDEKEKVLDIFEKDNATLAAITEAKSKRPQFKNTETPEELEIQKEIKRRKDIYGELNNKIKMPFTEQQEVLARLALLLVQSAFKEYNKELQIKTKEAEQKMKTKDDDSDSEYEEPLFDNFVKIIDYAINVLTLPQMVLKIAKFLSNEKLGILCLRVCKVASKKLQSQRQYEIDTLTKTKSDLTSISYEIVETAINSIFTNINHLTAKKDLSSRELMDLTILQGDTLKDLIEYHIPTYLTHPEGIIKIGKMLLGLKQFNYVVLVTERARIRMDELKVAQEERQRVEKHITDLKQDIASIKNVGGHPTAQQTELESLEKIAGTYKILPSHCFISTITHNDFLLQNAELRVSCILEMKAASKSSIPMNIDKELNDALDTIQDPTHIFKLAQLVHKHGENEATIRYGERCQKHISDLEKLREVRLPLQQTIDTLLNEEKSLRQVGKKLLPARQEELNKLQDKISLLPEWPSFGVLTARSQYDNLHLEVAQVMISSVLLTKKNLEEAKDTVKMKLVNKQFNQLIELCLEKFSDPNYLMKFANHMKDSREDQVMTRIITQLFKRSNEIESARQTRLGLQANLESVNSSIKKGNTIELLAKKKQIEADIEALPIWPHYAKLEQSRQYDDIKYQASTTLLNSLIDCLNFVEEKMRKKKMFDLKNMTDENLAKEQETLQKLIQEALMLCLSNLESINSIVKLAEELGPKNDRLFMEIAKVFHPKLKEFYDHAINYKKKEIMVKMLEEELAELTRMKKDMSDEDLALLENTRSELNGIQLPYVTDYLQDHIHHSKMVISGFKFVLDSRQAVLTKIGNNEIKQNESDAALSASKERITLLLDIIHNYVKNPQTYLDLLNYLLDKKEFATFDQVGSFAFEKLQEFREFQDQAAILVKEKTVILEEKEALDKQRRRLPTEKHKKLREILYTERLNNLLPAFYTQRVDDNALSIAKTLITSVSKEKTNFESNIAYLGEESLRQVANDRKKFNEKIQTTVKKCIEEIKSLETMMLFADDLFKKKEYLMVIQVGGIIEETLDQHTKLLEDKENLEKEIKGHQQRYLLTEDEKKRPKIQQTIDRKTAELQSMKPKYTYEQIKDFTLKITTLIIDSANFEDLGEVIRDQTIISFRIDTTPEKWDKIRNLSSEEEWAAIKEELVVFVMKRDENINSKIELLMKDGLLKQCIEIFPLPSPLDEELDNQLILLESLYDAVDEYEFSLIESILPLIQRYAKRCYQDWKYDKLNPLYDALQKRFPTKIAEMFTMATDMMLITILQSQYPTFLQMLKSFKTRMCGTLGKDDIWKKYVEEFKKKQKGKKKLLQMLSLINDSVWDLESINNTNPNVFKVNENSRAAKQKLSSASKSTPMKKIKVGFLPFSSTSASPVKKVIAKKDKVMHDDSEEDIPSTPVQSSDEEEDEENEDHEDYEEYDESD